MIYDISVTPEVTKMKKGIVNAFYALRPTSRILKCKASEIQFKGSHWFLSKIKVIKESL